MADASQIAMGVTGGQSGLSAQGSLAAPNALDTLSVLAKTQNELNTAKMFQQSFAARKKFGQIMASAPDMDTGLATAMADPDVAGFAPELANTAATARNTIIGSMGQVQTQGQDSFSHVLKGLPAVIQDPSQWNGLKNSALELASPVIRPRLAKALDYLYDGLTSDLPEDPEQARQAQLQRLVGWSMAGGVGDTIPKIIGQGAQVDVGPRIETGRIAPSQGMPGWLGGQAPGSFVPGGNPLTKGFSPQIAAPGGIPFKEGQGGGLAPAGAPAPAQPEAEAEPASARMSADGTPFLPEGYSMPGPSKRGDVIGGVPIGPAGTIAGGLAESFIGPELHAYNNAQQTMGLLYEMGKNFDTMAAGGGFLTPGSAGEARLALGKVINTFADMTGTNQLVDAKKLAAGEDIEKGTQRMGISVLSSLLGTQREAADTIRNMTEKGVPGVSNTPLGARLLVASIEQATARQIELYEFKNLWAQKHGGDLTGADAAFNELHPAQGYIKKALEQFGLDKSGFASEDAIRAAVSKGYLSPKDAVEATKALRAREKKE